MKKKILAVVLTLAMVVSFMPSMAFANGGEGGSGGATPAYGWYGDGTADVYTISTEAELIGFANIVNGTAGSGNPEKDSFSGKTVTLGNDITLTSTDWTPIGAGERTSTTYKDSSSPFEGTFDGNDKTISGLNIASGSGDIAVGLFGVVKGGTIKNLKLTDVNINVQENELAGGAVGFLVEDGTVDNVEVSGSISAKKGVGGIVGRMTISGTISNCVNSANVTAKTQNAGGIVGAAYYTENDKEMKISNCTNRGNITGGNVSIGGIAGLSAANISDCKNEGEIKGTNSGDKAINSVGGIVGGYQSYGSVTGCTNVADVSIYGKMATCGAGGIVGWIMYSGKSSDYQRCAAVGVKNNINKGSVTSNGSSAGGIVGHVQYMAVVTGNRNYAETISSNEYAAGIVGSVQEHTDSDVKGGCNAKKGLNVDISDNLTTTKIEEQSGKRFADVVWNDVTETGRTDVKYTEKGNIAGKVKVGDTGYWTLAEAVTKVEENKTITLLDNVTETTTVDITKDVTIDLNGKTITGDKCRVFWVRSGGDLNVTGKGTITSVDVEDHTKSVVRVGDSGEADFTMGEDVTIKAPNTYGVTIFGTGTQSMTINGTVNCTCDSDDACAVAGQGSEQYNANGVKTTITIGSNAKLATVNDVAIYKPNTGMLTIEDGAYIEGLGGIEVKAGEVEINGNPTIKATAETPSNKYNSDGSSTKGYAVSVLNIATGGGYKGKANVTINGGTFTGGIAILDNITTGMSVDAEKKGKITITGGLFNTKPDSTYCATGMAVVASGNSKYPFTVKELAVEEDVKVVEEAKAETTSECVTVIVDAEGKVIKIDGNSEEVKKISAAVSAAASAVAPAVGGTTATGLDVVATTEAAKITSTDVDKAKTELTSADVKVDETATVSIYVQPYLDIKITGNKITTASGNSGEVTATVTELTLDIVPMVKTIASTAESADAIVTTDSGISKTANAVELGEPKGVKVTTPVTITIPLPSGFVNDTNNIYIKHTKSNGASYVYTATVESNNEDSPTYSATFTNPNGFSEFVITKTDASVAKIGEVGYTSLQAAVNAVEEGGTIKLMKDNINESVTVSRTVEFTLDVNGKTGFNKDSIKAGSRTTKTVTDTNGNAPYTYNFVYTRSSSGGGGGGSTVITTTYDISVPSSIAHGSVSLSKNSAAENDKVTLTVKPDKGYTLEVLKATDASGKEVALTAVELGKEYTFVMPASKVSFEVSFMDDNSILNYFVDVNAADYFYDAVLWAAEKEITTGMDDSHFAPGGNCTRAQIVTFLWRAAGSPEVTTDKAFSDVASDSYYAKAVAWAVANGITTGTEADKFSPDDTCTRAQSVTFLARALKGTAEAGAEFSDVASDSYYASAVAWAKANGITMGVTESTFGPDNDCTRAQIVTFLYRGYANK